MTQFAKKIDQNPEFLRAEKLILRVHPKSESRLRGDKNSNTKKLKLRYPGIEFMIDSDNSLQKRDSVDIKPF